MLTEIDIFFLLTQYKILQKRITYDTTYKALYYTLHYKDDTPRSKISDYHRGYSMEDRTKLKYKIQLQKATYKPITDN